jgi:virginiamycin B lyase
MNDTRILVLAILAALLIACSGDDEPQAAATTVPAVESPEASSPDEAPTTSGQPTTAPSQDAEPEPLTEDDFVMETFEVPAGSHPHDVAPALDGGVWYTAQGSGELGWLDPETGDVREIPLGPNSRPHGVIIDEEGTAWVTDGGQNAIVSVDPETDEVTVYPLPADRPNTNLNTAAFDRNGVLWFTGQAGIYGSLDPATGEMQVYDAPNGRGPYGIEATPEGDIYFASLAGSYMGQIDIETGEATVIEPPTAGQGTRRVWSDSEGRIWSSQWNAGQVAVYDPEDGLWQEWPLPGGNPMAYAVYVDELDKVWLTDFGGDAIHRFDPETETFLTFDLPHAGGNVRQLLGRTGEVWAPESAVDQIIVIRFPSP